MNSKNINDRGIADSNGIPYLGKDAAEKMWVCEDPDLANIYVVNGVVMSFREMKVKEQLLLYGDFKGQIAYAYNTLPDPPVQPADNYFLPQNYKNSREIQGRILIAERALAATCGDPMKASQNMFIPTDIPHCSLCKVRSDDPKISLKKCAKCNKELYCSRECQVVDWSLNHKFKCIAHADSTPANSA